MTLLLLQLIAAPIEALAAGRGAVIRLLGDQRGQAMVEYSTLTFAILIGAGAAGFGMRWSEFHNQTLAAVLYQALQTYVDSVNYALSLAAT